MVAACVPIRAQESRYVGFGNTAPPQKRDDDFLNNAMSSLYSVRTLSWGPSPPIRLSVWLRSQALSVTGLLW